MHIVDIKKSAEHTLVCISPESIHGHCAARLCLDEGVGSVVPTPTKYCTFAPWPLLRPFDALDCVRSCFPNPNPRIPMRPLLAPLLLVHLNFILVEGRSLWPSWIPLTVRSPFLNCWLHAVDVPYNASNIDGVARAPSIPPQYLTNVVGTHASDHVPHAYVRRMCSHLGGRDSRVSTTARRTSGSVTRARQPP